MIEDVEERGAIEPGQTILEPTSGNTGISLAMICSAQGLSAQGGDARQRHRGAHQLLHMYGAEIVPSEGRRAPTARSSWRWRWPRATPPTTCPTSTATRRTPRAHYEGTAPEILDELDEVTAFVGGLGTGGTLMGNGRRLKEENPETKIVAAEPMQGELVQGLRSLDDGFIPPIIDLCCLDRKIMVSNRDAILWTQKLLHEEGLFAGVSSGAIAYVADRIARELDEGNVVFLVPDDGWKYLSSGVYTSPVEELEGIDSTVWW